MRVPSYCFKSLENIFYFRMKVPKELRPFLNRTELKKSLHTKEKSTAIRLCRQYVLTAEKVFESLRLKLFQTSLTGNDADSFNQSSLFTFMEQPSSGAMREAPPREDEKEITLSKLIQLYVDEVTSKRGRDTSMGIEKNLLRFSAHAVGRSSAVAMVFGMPLVQNFGPSASVPWPSNKYLMCLADEDFWLCSLA